MAKSTAAAAHAGPVLRWWVMRLDLGTSSTRAPSASVGHCMGICKPGRFKGLACTTGEVVAVHTAGSDPIGNAPPAGCGVSSHPVVAPKSFIAIFTATRCAGRSAREAVGGAQARARLGLRGRRGGSTMCALSTMARLALLARSLMPLLAVVVAMLVAGPGLPGIVASLGPGTSHVCTCASGGSHAACPICNGSLASRRSHRVEARGVPCGERRLAGDTVEAGIVAAPVARLQSAAVMRLPAALFELPPFEDVPFDPSTPPPRVSGA